MAVSPPESTISCVSNTRTSANVQLRGFRKGALAVPLYLIVVGIAHVALALEFSRRTEFLARDGQAFSGTAVIGVLFVFAGLLALGFALAFERDSAGLTRGAIAALIMTAVVAGYTAASTAVFGYFTGGTPGVLNCIVEGGREICPPGDGTWIADARTDVLVLMAGALVAYFLSHAFARWREATASLSP